MSEGSIYELTLVMGSQGNQIINSFGFVQKSVTAGFLADELVTAWRSGVDTSLRACLGANTGIDIYRVTDVVPGIAARYETSFTTNYVSTGAATTSPQQIASLISWKTGRAGRSYRGRTYLSPVPSTFFTRDVLASAGSTALAAFVAAMLGVFGPAGSNPNFQFAIISRWNDKAKLPVPIATGVTSGVARVFPATQRRRRLGVGS